MAYSDFNMFSFFSPHLVENTLIMPPAGYAKGRRRKRFNGVQVDMKDTWESRFMGKPSKGFAIPHDTPV